MKVAVIDVIDGDATLITFAPGWFECSRPLLADATLAEMDNGVVHVAFYDHQPLCSKIEHANGGKDNNADNN